MTRDDIFTVEPWAIAEGELHLDVLARTESVFALSNGHIGLRGNLDEGEPYGLPGTYLNGFYETRPLPYAEAGYGYPGGRPDRGQRHQRQGDPAAGRRRAVRHPLRRAAAPRAAARPARRRCSRARSSGARPPAARCACARAGWSPSRSARSRRSPTRSSRSRPPAARGPPERAGRQRAGAAAEQGPARGGGARLPAALRGARRLTGCARELVHVTKRSGLRMAAGMDHVVEGPEGTVTDAESRDDLGAHHGHRRPRAGRAAARGQGRSATAGRAGARCPRCATRSPPRWPRRASRAGTAWPTSRRRTSTTSGRAPTSSSTATPSSSRPCASRSSTRCRRARGPSGGRSPAKGLTGPGYDGHTFWDTESFVLPVLTYTAPAAAADALRWRHATLDLAIERAHQLGLDGAAFPWRTIRGQECSSYWPAGTAAFHIGADIAAAVVRYVLVTGDEEFEAHGRPRPARRHRAPVALARPPRRPRAASTSTASPAPTSTPRWSTTTPTRT